jgi:hypothetical protein
VIVAETSRVTIYDGDDPDMPMWMVFNRSSSSVSSSWTFLGGTPDSFLTCIFMSNGLLAVGSTQTSASGFAATILLNFLSETISIRYFNGSFSTSNSAFVNRNLIQSFTGSNSGAIISGLTNDVAMTVLPNAPIDSATGLPVPTIAVACGSTTTSGGVSIIKDDGNVINFTSTSFGATHYSDAVSFTNDKRLIASKNTAGTSRLLIYSTSRPISEYSTSLLVPTNTPSGENFIFYTPTNHPFEVTDSVRLLISSQQTGLFNIANNAISNIQQSVGFNLVGLAPKGQQDMVAYITSSYNTGWMHGDIKGAWLSDTSTASVTGTELVTNGTFTTNTTGWTAVGGTLTVSSGRAQHVTTSNAQVTQLITCEVGKVYQFSYVHWSGYTSAYIDANGDASGAVLSLGDAIGTGPITKFGRFTATQSSYYVTIYGIGNTTSTYDDVSVRLEEPDRSVNNKGLQVFGTIIKSSVATGSNLVAYGGFTASNYLQQPTNSALSFGTNPFSIMMWFKTPTGGTGTEVLISWRDLVGSNPLWQIYLNSTSSISFDFQGSQNGGATFNNPLRDNTWHLLTAVQRSASLREFYIDSNLVATNTTTLSPGFSIEDAVLRVGTHYDSNYAYTGSLSLLRVSASAPSPEQIRKIYNDEKALFQPNSQCTLYGSSDAVTALAYDDTSRLLHVGTSSGRSEFKGLVRVGNTTTAVTASISASNGLVAEQ